jgi:hypothetical protein
VIVGDVECVEAEVIALLKQAREFVAALMLDENELLRDMLRIFSEQYG